MKRGNAMHISTALKIKPMACLLSLLIYLNNPPLPSTTIPCLGFLSAFLLGT
jgi:hypothetical protein